MKYVKALMAPLATCLLSASTSLAGQTLSTQQIAQTNNSFGWKLFQTVEQSTASDANILLSPLSAWLALSLTSNGADGQTLAEMQSALAQQGFSQLAANEAIHDLMNSLVNGDETAETLRLANAIWANSDRFTLAQNFVDDAETFYSLMPDQTIAHSEPFSQPATLAQINQWVDKQTNGMIPSILEKLEPNMAAIILNALFFEAQWYKPFSEQSLAEETFYKADGSVATVNMMRENQTAFQYAADDRFKMLSLAFRANSGDDVQPIKGRYRLDLILPQQNFNLSSLTANDYQSLTEKLQSRVVKVALPTLKFTYKNQLNAALQNLGIKQAFEPGKADFSRMSQTATPGDLYIDSVLQKTALEMDENGLKAAAVTAVIISETSVPPPATVSFIANKPFFLSLRDVKTGALLFLGLVANPLAD
jgi:serpin B